MHGCCSSSGQEQSGTLAAVGDFGWGVVTLGSTLGFGGEISVVSTLGTPTVVGATVGTTLFCLFFLSSNIAINCCITFLDSVLTGWQK